MKKSEDRIMFRSGDRYGIADGYDIDGRYIYPKSAQVTMDTNGNTGVYFTDKLWTPPSATAVLSDDEYVALNREFMKLRKLTDIQRSTLDAMVTAKLRRSESKEGDGIVFGRKVLVRDIGGDRNTRYGIAESCTVSENGRTLNPKSPKTVMESLGITGTFFDSRYWIVPETMFVLTDSEYDMLEAGFTEIREIMGAQRNALVALGELKLRGETNEN
jgi:hypothetical protein